MDTPPFDDLPPSKSQKKREMLALQELGTQLARLSPEQLRKMDLPADLAAALADAQRFANKRGALRRQLQYVGKLMRGVDAEPIRAQLDALQGRRHASGVRTSKPPM